MAQEYDYTLPNPMVAFEQSYNFGNAIAARDAEKVKNQRAQEALQSIIEDRSPENIASKLLLFPALKEQITASESVLNDAEKTSANQFRSAVLGLYKAGNPTAARARLAAQAEGYKNTVGKEKQAAAAQALLKTYDTEPEYLMTTMAVQLAQSDDKLYKTLFDAGELTAFQKNQKAAGVDPKSPQGMEQSRQYLELQVDPIVEIEAPGGGKFVGPRSEYFRRYGPSAQQPTVKALPAIGEVRGGFKFNGGNPADKNNWSKVGTSGGQTEKPSGNFR